MAVWEQQELSSTSKLSSRGTGVMRRGTAAEQEGRAVKQGRGAEGASCAARGLAVSSDAVGC